MALSAAVGAAAESMGLGPSVWMAVAIFVGVDFLVAERVHRVATALGGAGLVLAFGIVDSDRSSPG